MQNQYNYNNVKLIKYQVKFCLMSDEANKSNNSYEAFSKANSLYTRTTCYKLKQNKKQLSVEPDPMKFSPKL